MFGTKKWESPEGIKLGQKVRCRITGFQGIVTGLYEYLHGCARICVQPAMKEDGTLAEDRVLDAPQLEIIDKKQIIKAPISKTKVEIGEKAKDQISGFSGVVYARATFINGCHKVGLAPDTLDKDNKIIPTEWFDENQLELTQKEPVIKKSERSTKSGGPAPCRDKSRFF